VPEEENTSKLELACDRCRRASQVLILRYKCDLQKPSCQNCCKSRRQCEGYARFPIFLNRTTDGVVQRSHLEEAKTVSCQKKPPSEKLSRLARVSPLALLEISTCQSWKIQVIAWFWESHADLSKFDDGGVAATESNSHWLYRTLEVSHPLPVLERTLSALSASRYGRIIGNLDMAVHGQRLYGLALKSMQQAMYDEATMLSDETLMSVRILVLYEVRETPSLGHLDHCVTN
jgi:hypothetical protein